MKLIDQLKQAFHAEPFQPFALHLDDGRKIEVWHREWMCISPSCRRIAVHQPNDSFDVIDLWQVRQIEANRALSGTTAVLIEPDLVQAFPDSESVNRALRLLLDAARESVTGARRRRVPNSGPKRRRAGRAKAAM